MHFKTWLAILTLSTTSVTAVQALACGNSYEYELDLPTKVVIQAEQRLAQGKYQQAYETAYTAISGKNSIGTEPPKPKEAWDGSTPISDKSRVLLNRAYRVAAIAVIQSPTPIKGVDDAWAIAKLQEIDAREKSPFVMARIAEGLAKNANTKSEAIALLRDLVEEDLMPDARAWMTWAALQPDGPVREDALKKCQLRAKQPAECVLATQS